MKGSLDELLKRSQEIFSTNHDSLRDALLASLPEPAAASKQRARTFPLWNIIGGTKMKRRLLLAASAAAALFFVLYLPSGSSRNGVVWADVVRQIRSARTIRLRAVEKTGPGQERSSEYCLKWPGLMRGTDFLADGISGTIINGGKQMRWNSVNRLYIIEPLGYPAPSQGSIQFLLGVCGLSGVPEKDRSVSLPAPAGGAELQLSQAGTHTRNGRNLRKYAVEMLVNGNPAGTGTFLWFDPRDNQLVMLTTEDAAGTETASATVEVNVDLPDETFSLTPPSGYTDITKGVLPRLAPEVRTIAEKYYAARDRFTRYQVLVWQWDWPRYREVRDGSRWRLDRLGFTTMFSNKTKYAFTGPDQDFSSAWALAGTLDTPLDTTLFTYKGRLAIAGYDFGGPGPKVAGYFVDRPREGWQNFDHFRFAELAWPEFRDDELHAPHGWVLDAEALQYELLPPDPGHPGIVRIRGTRSAPVDNYYEYWIDPAHDYLCVRYEERRTQKTAAIQEITEFGTTSDHRWFPKAVKRYGRALVDGRYGDLSYGPILCQIRIDTSHPIDPRMFEWPKRVPEPK